MYRVESLAFSDVNNIIDFAKENSYGLVFDARETGDKTRYAVSPYDVGGLCGENGLLYIDQLVFGEHLSPELSMVMDDQMDEWWCNAFSKWYSSFGVIFLTSATSKSIDRGTCLAKRIIERVTTYQGC